jgi:hypothetical protein
MIQKLVVPCSYLRLARSYCRSHFSTSYTRTYIITTHVLKFLRVALTKPTIFISFPDLTMLLQHPNERRFCNHILFLDKRWFKQYDIRKHERCQSKSVSTWNQEAPSLNKIQLSKVVPLKILFNPFKRTSLLWYNWSTHSFNIQTMVRRSRK